MKERLLCSSAVDLATGCRNWIGWRNIHGYGYMNINGLTKRAHRVAYEEYVGQIPAGLSVLHRCDNPRCINPDHLFLGNHQDNMADMVAKRRNATGARHGQSKVTFEQVAAIRKEVGSQATIAKKYGLSQSQISRIKSGWSWDRSCG